MMQSRFKQTHARAAGLVVRYPQKKQNNCYDDGTKGKKKPISLDFPYIDNAYNEKDTQGRGEIEKLVTIVFRVKRNRELSLMMVV